jgi:catechol 2,3-dioxygenase-like lactoylglutathione lyase family enzyme
VKSWTVFAVFLLLAKIRSTTQRPASEAQLHVEPALINVCLITNDVKPLTAFYSQVLQIEPHRSGDDYVEFPTRVGTLALFAATAQEKYIPGSATAGQNRSSILEFRVGNVDEEYARLRPVVKSWVKGPTTQPWGTRSIYFRDPDGNLVDLFTPPATK